MLWFKRIEHLNEPVGVTGPRFCTSGRSPHLGDRSICSAFFDSGTPRFKFCAKIQLKSKIPA